MTQKQFINFIGVVVCMVGLVACGIGDLHPAYWSFNSFFLGTNFALFVINGRH